MMQVGSGSILRSCIRYMGVTVLSIYRDSMTHAMSVFIAAYQELTATTTNNIITYHLYAVTGI